MLYRIPGTRRDIGWLYRRLAILSALADRSAEWWRIRCDINRLAAIDDRLLEDIGIRREEIAARVMGKR